MRVELALGFWILPSFAIVAPFAFFRLFSPLLETPAAAIIALAATGGLEACWASTTRSTARRGAAFGAARPPDGRAAAGPFSLFGATYYARLRFLYSGALIGLTGALLAYALLQWTPPRRGLLVLAGMVGITLAEATDSTIGPRRLLGGALLLVIFYVAIGLVNHLEGTRFRGGCSGSMACWAVGCWRRW